VVQVDVEAEAETTEELEAEGENWRWKTRHGAPHRALGTHLQFLSLSLWRRNLPSEDHPGLVAGMNHNQRLGPAGAAMDMVLPL